MNEIKEYRFFFKLYNLHIIINKKVVKNQIKNQFDKINYTDLKFLL